jgi:hypothetical protein
LATTSPDAQRLVKGAEVDIVHGELVEKELDAMIERRHDRRVSSEAEGHRPSEEMYEESTRRYQEQMCVRARCEWHLHHTAQAERLRRTLESLIANHEEQAEKYLEKGNQK